MAVDTLYLHSLYNGSYTIVNLTLPGLSNRDSVRDIAVTGDSNTLKLIVTVFSTSIYQVLYYTIANATATLYQTIDSNAYDPVSQLGNDLYYLALTKNNQYLTVTGYLYLFYLY